LSNLQTHAGSLPTQKEQNAEESAALVEEAYWVCKAQNSQ